MRDVRQVVCVIERPQATHARARQPGPSVRLRPLWSRLHSVFQPVSSPSHPLHHPVARLQTQPLRLPVHGQSTSAFLRWRHAVGSLSHGQQLRRSADVAIFVAKSWPPARLISVFISSVAAVAWHVQTSSTSADAVASKFYLASQQSTCSVVVDVRHSNVAVRNSAAVRRHFADWTEFYRRRSFQTASSQPSQVAGIQQAPWTVFGWRLRSANGPECWCVARP